MQSPSDDSPAASVFVIEVVTAIVILVFAGIVVFDSLRLGAGWGDDGPKSGYFPFYIGLLLAGASVANLIAAWRRRVEQKVFVGRGELRLVLAMLIPSLLYVGVIQMLGIYVASAVFIAVFMRWQGKFAIWLCTLTGIGVSVLLFLVFQIWFKISLPKGPLEAALGY
jgi:hypothetical protein